MAMRGMGINILLREGMGMFLCTQMGMDGNGNTIVGMGRNEIEKVIPAYLYFKFRGYFPKHTYILLPYTCSSQNYRFTISIHIKQKKQQV